MIRIIKPTPTNSAAIRVRETPMRKGNSPFTASIAAARIRRLIRILIR